ncbi:MAG: hypothetical protein PUB66_01375, partial [Oscillospiraceae bacterium]|nr:hypothetical protein [Oscillospiraceae bacterium]
NREQLRSLGEPMKYYSKLPELTGNNQEIPYNPNPRSYNKGQGGSKDNRGSDNRSNTQSFGPKGSSSGFGLGSYMRKKEKKK